MTEVRKYELENCHGGEPISATDDRDIQPLVDAARNCLIEERGKLLKWLRSKRIESERQARHAKHRQGAELHSAASLAFEAVEDYVHQLQANEEKGGGG